MCHELFVYIRNTDWIAVVHTDDNKETIEKQKKNVLLFKREYIYNIMKHLYKIELMLLLVLLHRCRAKLIEKKDTYPVHTTSQSLYT